MNALTPDLIAVLIVMGIAPLLIIGITCFTKFAVVLAILRNAIGVQQIPPNIVIYSLATIMSAYVMLPVFLQAGAAVESAQVAKVPVLSKTQEIVKPFLDFTTAHADPNQVAFFEDTAKKLWGEKTAATLTGPQATNLSKLIISMPAFMVSELTKAFQIGFLLFLPFVVIDLLVANVLLALGMSTLSPVTVSLPIKVLLFIGLNGWQRVLESLALSYT